LLCIVGCSSSARKPVSVAGIVKTSSGQLVTGVRLILEPVSEPKVGATFGFDLDSEGRFAGDALPGTYIFYFATLSVERDDDNLSRPVNADEAKKLQVSGQALNKIPAAYRTSKNAGEDRKVEVKSGATLTLTVSQ
jgi:hypothetical protein